MVVLPAALPKIFAGLRLSLSISLILMVVSELVGATDGIGYQLDTPSSTSTSRHVGLDRAARHPRLRAQHVLLAVERRALRWQPTAPSRPRLTGG